MLLVDGIDVMATGTFSIIVLVVLTGEVVGVGTIVDLLLARLEKFKIMTVTSTGMVNTAASRSR